MAKGETIGDLIRNGFNTYRHNLKISIPFLLYNLLVFATLLPTVILSLGFESAIESKAEIPFWIFFGILMMLLISILAILSGSVFLAGTVGMAMEATLKGKTSFSTLWFVGKKNWMRILHAAGFMYLCVYIICMIIFIFLSAVGDVLLYFSMSAVLELSMLLLFIVSISIVVDDLKAFKGIERGLKFITSLEQDVILVFLAFLVLSIAINIADCITGPGFISTKSAIFDLLPKLAFFAKAIVLYPLFVVLWTRLYMDRTGKLGEVGSKTSSLTATTDLKKDQNGTQTAGQK